MGGSIDQGVYAKIRQLVLFNVICNPGIEQQTLANKLSKFCSVCGLQEILDQLEFDKAIYKRVLCKGPQVSLFSEVEAAISLPTDQASRDDAVTYVFPTVLAECGVSHA
eukprot:Colp12_sorted_trinity150504_noHs@8005